MVYENLTWVSFLIWNAIVMLLYGIDKHNAIQKRWRIKNSVLIGCAFLLGGMGAAAGMTLFHHKTKQPLFKFYIFIALLVNLVILYFAGADFISEIVNAIFSYIGY